MNIDTLVRELDALEDPQARAVAQQLVQSLMDMHAEAFDRMLAMSDAPLVEKFANDELIGSLLLLYGLHPEPVEARVEAALERVRPYLRSHGGSVALAGISEDGIVHLRLDGSCNGCPSSERTIKLAIEDAIFEAAPEVRQVIGTAGVGQTLLSVPAQTGVSAPHASAWETLDLASLHEGGRIIDVAGKRLFVCRSGENLYAWGSACPGCSASLGDAAIDGGALRCVCGRRFDLLAAGRELDDPAMHLEPFPLLIEHGQARVALP